MERGQSHGACLHTSPTADYPHGRLKAKVDLNIDHIKKMQREARLRSTAPSDRVGYLEKDTRFVCFPYDKRIDRVETSADHILKPIVPVQGVSAPQRCSSSAVSRLEVSQYATSTFRAFELTVVIAIDVWSAGMILLFFLTKKFPLFQSNDDTEALMEIAIIIGRRRMEKTATLHSTYRTMQWGESRKLS